MGRGKQTGGTHIGGNRLCGNRQWKQTVANGQWKTDRRDTDCGSRLCAKGWSRVEFVTNTKTAADKFHQDASAQSGVQPRRPGCGKPQEVPQWPLLGSVKMLFWDQHGRGVSARGSFATPHRRTALQDFPVNPLVLGCQGCQ